MNLMKAIQNKYGFKPGLTLVGDEIRDWPYKEARPEGEELDELKSAGEKEQKKTEVKNLTSKKILRKCPLWKQSNLLMDMALLISKDNNDLTEADRKKINNIKQQMRDIAAIRAYGSKLERKIDKSKDVSSIDVLKGWPGDK